MLSFALYFALGLGMDFLLVHYQKSVISNRPCLASFLSLIISLMAILVVSEYTATKDYWLLLGYACGNAVGTFIGVKAKIFSYKKSNN